MRMILKAAKDWGWLLALAVAICALALEGALNFNPVEEVGRPVVSLIISPEDAVCQDGWMETRGTDPDSNIAMRVCTSPDHRYVITIRDGKGVAGYDSHEARFLSPNEAAGFLR